MGRTLQNTMVNLALENACDEATYQVRQRIMGKGPSKDLSQEVVASNESCNVYIFLTGNNIPVRRKENTAE